MTHNAATNEIAAIAPREIPVREFEVDSPVDALRGIHEISTSVLIRLQSHTIV